jgi:hypothetical protein
MMPKLLRMLPSAPETLQPTMTNGGGEPKPRPKQPPTTQPTQMEMETPAAAAAMGMETAAAEQWPRLAAMDGEKEDESVFNLLFI